jgi:uncharacterized protein YndB with AHSA1/START domain
MRTITKAIDVDAPPERVWDVLLDDATYRQWTAEFMAGSYAETDWQEGSTVRFLDPSGSGMLGHIVASRRPELVDVEFDGVVADGKDDTETDHAREYRGARETYRLTRTPSGTRLDISGDMGEQYYDDMAAAWDRALAKVKALAEAPGR